MSTALHMASLERGGLSFFIERQRRSIFELSRSVYMQNLITYTQGQSEVTEQQILKMESFIHAYKKYFGYKQVLLLNRQGAFVFSTLPALRGKNIYDEAYKADLILPSYKLVSMTLTSDITVFNFSPVLQERAICISMPVFFEGALNGCLVVQLDDNEIAGMLAENTKMVGAEEYLIVQRLGNVINFIMSPVLQPNLTLQIRPEISRSIGAPSERAALGYEGYGITDNHLGQPVVGSWYYLPQLNWGFICKDSYAYAMRYVRWFGYSIIFFAICLFIATCIYLIRRYVIVRKKSLPPSDILQ